MRRSRRWKSGLGFLALFAAFTFVLVAALNRRIASPPTEKAAEAQSKPTSHETESEQAVVVDREAQERLGLKLSRATAATLEPECVAFGELQADPEQSFTLRAPVVGTLQAAEDGSWPALGRTLKEGARIGSIHPRLNAAERADFSSRLALAQSESDEVKADLDAARASFEGKRGLNVDNKIVSDRALEEARAKVRGLEARLEGAKKTVQLIEAALKQVGGATGQLPLIAMRGGDVVEVFAQPGEAIESGQPIIRVARFDRLIATVSTPIGSLPAPRAKSARIVPLGAEESLVGRIVGIGPVGDLRTGATTLLVSIENTGGMLRPGIPVTAYLPGNGPKLRGVIVPRGAVVRYLGEDWVFVAADKNRFVRRVVKCERTVNGGWFITRGIQPQDRVVAVGAGLLLSEQLKSTLGSEDVE